MPGKSLMKKFNLANTVLGVENPAIAVDLVSAHALAPARTLARIAIYCRLTVGKKEPL